MNKEETVKIKVKLPLITDEDIRVLDNNFGYIVNEVIKAQCKERELALLQLIIKKQQQVLISPFNTLSIICKMLSPEQHTSV